MNDNEVNDILKKIPTTAKEQAELEERIRARKAHGMGSVKDYEDWKRANNTQEGKK